MNRSQCIGEIVESLRLSQRAACGRLARVPGIAVTPSEWGLLNLLHQDGGQSVKDLAKAMNITGSAVTQLANDLVDKGYIKRTTEERDKRTTKLVPTAKCNRMMGGIQKSFSDQCSILFSKLTDLELQTLSRLHRKIVKTLH